MTNYNKPIKEDEKTEALELDDKIKMEVSEGPAEDLLDMHDSEEPGETALEAIVISKKLNVRKAPSKDAPVVGIISKDDTVFLKKALIVDKLWTPISTETIPKGFVMTEFIREV